MQHLLNQIHLADCMDIMRQLPDKCIDLVLTDPPYGIKADSGTNGFGETQNRKYASGWDNTRPSAEHFNQMLRVAKKLIVFGGNYFADLLPVSKCWIVWDKIGEYSFQNPFADVELAWTNFTKTSKKYTVIQQGFIAKEKDRLHPTQKPVSLFQSILQDYAEAGQVILDPFSGSGTTAIACHNLGLNFICVEKDPAYHTASVQRLNKHKEQLLLPL